MSQRTRHALMGVALLMVCAQAGSAEIATNASAPTATNADDGNVVYYFHRTGRCHTCLAMEEWTRQFVASAPERRLTVSVINLDLPENEHFVQDFEITFNTVVLAEVKDGKPARWKNLAAVWDVSQDESAFTKYLEGEATAFFDPPH